MLYRDHRRERDDVTVLVASTGGFEPAEGGHEQGAAGILTIDIRYEQDVVLTRQRARQIAGLLGFSTQEQTALATAVSEIARNAFRYAGGGRVEFAVGPDEPPQTPERPRPRQGAGHRRLDGRSSTAGTSRRPAWAWASSAPSG